MSGAPVRRRRRGRHDRGRGGRHLSGLGVRGRDRALQRLDLLVLVGLRLAVGLELVVELLDLDVAVGDLLLLVGEGQRPRRRCPQNETTRLLNGLRGPLRMMFRDGGQLRATASMAIAAIGKRIGSELFFLFALARDDHRGISRGCGRRCAR